MTSHITTFVNETRCHDEKFFGHCNNKSHLIRKFSSEVGKQPGHARGPPFSLEWGGA